MEFELRINEIDEKKVETLLNNLDSEHVKSLIRSAARKGINIVTKEARRNLEAVINPSQSMIDSVSTVSVTDNDFIGASSRALKNKKYYDSYKLLFFERGTKERFTKQNISRGHIDPTHFFENAVSSKGNAAVEKFRQVIDLEIKKINDGKQ